MAIVLVCLVLFLAMTGHSSGTYCVCKDGLSDSVYQKNIDYACGAGADCSAIIQNGVCYNPNTVKDHCNYAVNSYFQKKSQVTGSCDFSGTATTTQTLTSSTSGCVYPRDEVLDKFYVLNGLDHRCGSVVTPRKPSSMFSNWVPNWREA